MQRQRSARRRVRGIIQPVRSQLTGFTDEGTEAQRGGNALQKPTRVIKAELAIRLTCGVGCVHCPMLGTPTKCRHSHRNMHTDPHGRRLGAQARSHPSGHKASAHFQVYMLTCRTLRGTHCPPLLPQDLGVTLLDLLSFPTLPPPQPGQPPPPEQH